MGRRARDPQEPDAFLLFICIFAAFLCFILIASGAVRV